MSRNASLRPSCQLGMKRGGKLIQALERVRLPDWRGGYIRHASLSYTVLWPHFTSRKTFPDCEVGILGIWWDPLETFDWESLPVPLGDQSEKQTGMVPFYPDARADSVKTEYLKAGWLLFLQSIILSTRTSHHLKVILLSLLPFLFIFLVSQECDTESLFK